MRPSFRVLAIASLVLMPFVPPAPNQARSMPLTPPLEVIEPADTPSATQAGPRFEISVDPDLPGAPFSGRLFVALAPANRRGEPRRSIGETGLDTPPVIARDATDLAPGRPCVLDASCVTFPIARLADLPAGAYRAQALLDRPNDTRDLDAPGNLVSRVVEIQVDPNANDPIRLTLDRALPSEPPPAETDQVKYISLQSKLLSDFHGRPFTIRAGVILPKGFDREPNRRYPLRVHIGGYGERYTGVARLMSPGSSFRAAWNAESAPRVILLHLDGDGPFGDPYQVNSANHGPYGDAIVRELIPHVESRFRGLGTGQSRVLDGGSTGGWVALALQVFYPDVFNGAWSFCPDGVDFRSFQLVNIYEDANAYVNEHGFERPAARDRDGDVRYTMRHECSLENLLGPGDSYTNSGGQWGAWNATFGPRGADGLPVPLWNPTTGAIDRSVVDHWKKYDLRLVLERDWATLGPKLRGKIHIWVGESDDFFLNNAVHRLDTFLSHASPPSAATITYGPGQGHCWMPFTQAELMEQMGRAVGGE